MNCQDVRSHLVGYGRGQLQQDLLWDIGRYLAGCGPSAHERMAETALTTTLEHRLPQYAASPALKCRLAANPTTAARRPCAAPPATRP
jgi:hypothetical protein